jgi:hypothetical protein
VGRDREETKVDCEERQGEGAGLREQSQQSAAVELQAVGDHPQEE